MVRIRVNRSMWETIQQEVEISDRSGWFSIGQRGKERMEDGTASAKRLYGSTPSVIKE